jgi:hypothetical protein
MGRHIVRAFHAVHPTRVRRRQALERGDKIGLHVGIGVLLNNQRRRRVLEIDEHGAVACVDLFKKPRDVARDLKETFAGGRHGQ